jgi:hypothetical protein
MNLNALCFASWANAPLHLTSFFLNPGSDGYDLVLLKTPMYLA